MSTGDHSPVPRPTTHPVAVVADQTLTAAEARYVDAARAANTVRGYRADWTDFTTWCHTAGHTPLPADPATLTGYLTALAARGLKVGTISRRLSAITFAHTVHDLPDPTTGARVLAVWEGIRRTHTTPPTQALPLMPPLLHDVLDACPVTRTWTTPGRDPEPDLAGLRDRALLLTGFVTALRRSELAALDVDHLAEHPRGLVATIGRSKTNQTGAQPELVVIPHGTHPRRCPVTALNTWLDAADITGGPVFRPVSKGNHALARRLHPESMNTLIRNAIHRAGTDASGYSAHSLRAGFVTHAHLRGATDRAIAHQTRHRSLATLGTYVRIHTAWDDNAATQLGL
ncbi:tyrosine-type recombinase/integrase [Mycobacterium hodleri]|uniref:site-specific integrase n=1 Tax=Mycolicibacterium hodleri TaxID=49897 RepID=UPI0021F28D37|nr:site-specific integrase [Mycolicibacterium hodleri]MCV7137112.1 tyrosine-type recombinase/integrase [Mycolicibacterium hodleri]